MTRHIRLLTGRLHYGPEVKLHTATSGPVSQLDETYLLIEQEGRTLGLGGVRTNIAYLTGIAGDRINRELVDWVNRIDWSQSVEALAEEVVASREYPGPVKALLDQTLHDALARESGLTLCEWLGGAWKGAASTNQTLFWGDNQSLLNQAEAYVARGFCSLKLRVAVETFEQDIARLKLLRDRFGHEIKLAADANGRWTGESARRNVAALDAFSLDYIEQPVAAEDWETLRLLSREAPMPVMLDESLAEPSAVRRLIEIGGSLAGHLKLVKFGGVAPLMEAADALVKAGVRCMVGQMNEGSLATAAAAHCAMALGAEGNELYGADGILDDPAHGLSYGSGMVSLPKSPGLGMTFSTLNLTPIWERKI